MYNKADLKVLICVLEQLFSLLRTIYLQFKKKHKKSCFFIIWKIERIVQMYRHDSCCAQIAVSVPMLTCRGFYCTWQTSKGTLSKNLCAIFKKNWLLMCIYDLCFQNWWTEVGFSFIAAIYLAVFPPHISN